MNFNTILSYNKLAVAGLSSLLLLNASCIELADNINPDEVTEQMMAVDNLKTGAFFSQMLRNVVIFKDGKNLDSDYQVSQLMTGDIFSGYIAPTYAGNQGKHNGTYSFIASWGNLMFEKAYTNEMAPWNTLVKLAEQQGLPEIKALATIVKVEAMHRVVDTYGPIPYCNYGKDGASNIYDSMEAIYRQFFEELDTSIDVLTDYVHGNVDAQLMSDFDFVYGGKVEYWVKFANTLRLRLANRVYYADPILARTEAEKSIANSIGLIEKKAERAELKHSSALIYHHPLYEIAYHFNSGEARMSAAMDSYLNGYSDPRLQIYFKPASDDGKYHGVRLGITPANWSEYSGSKISSLNMDDTTTPIVWMTAAESFFLRAEGALRGWNMEGTAEELYEKGVMASFEENGLSGVESYLTNSTSKPADFQDVVGSNSQGAVSTVTIAWDENAGLEQKLERIITQKWIAMFPDGYEAWAEFRRTGYPKLFTVVNNFSNGTINTDVQVRRVPYPQDEYTNNATGVASGVKQLGGQDTGGVKLWWDKK